MSTPVTTADGRIVDAVGVHKAFGSVSVLDGVDLRVDRGEVVVLLGESGSGKTTLLRCLSLAEGIDRGTLRFMGSVVASGDHTGMSAASERRELRKRIGIVFQQFNLFPHMSALDNVALAPIHVLKTPKELARNQALELLDSVGLKDRADFRPGRLSGGQQQRVAIARTLAMSPTLLLFDEVTSALDPRMTAEVLSVMKDLARDGSTMVVVTHEMAFARNVGSRIVFMADGRIVEEGGPSEIFDDPHDPRTREFFSTVQGVS